MECACIDHYEGGTSFYQDRIATARKEHQCCECCGKIEPGEKYEVSVGVSDGDFFHQKTCQSCTDIRHAYFCSWEFGSMWEAMRETHGDIPLADFEGFNVKTQQKILEMM